MTNSETNPNSETRKEAPALVAASRQSAALSAFTPEVGGALPKRRYDGGSAASRLRFSVFGLPSDFGFRTSDFGLISALLLLLFPACLRAADPTTVLTAWLAAQTNASTWSADFIQTRSLKALSHPLVATGHVWFARPNHFRWELGQPVQTLAVRDDDQLQVIYPRLRRAERYPLTGGKSGPLGEALGLLDAGFPKSRADFDARFRVVSLQVTNAAWLMELQPVSAAARRMMPSIQVTLATNNFMLLANELSFPDGSRMRNDFTNAALNEVFAADFFRPTLAPDFKIVEPLTQ